MAYQPATTLGLASAFVIGMAPCAPAWGQCEATESGEVAPSDGQIGDLSGYSVAVSGNAILVGSPHEDQGASDAGAAYAFRFNGTSWVQEQKLMAGDPNSQNTFGSAVAIDGDVAVLSAPLDDQAGTNAGSAYVFRFNGGNWVQEQKLLPWNPPVSLGSFGHSVALDGNVVALGAPMTGTGKVYVLRYINNQWAQEDIVTAGDAAFGDRFGISVAVSDDVLLVGANRDDDNGAESGSVYVFHYEGINGWVQVQKLAASDGHVNNGFGWAVSLSSNAALIGANYDSGSFGSGAAYVFRYNGSSWNQEQKLSSPAGAPADNEFAFSVSIDGDVAIVGSMRGNGSVSSSGTAFIYSYNGSTWTEQAEVMASNGQCNAECDQFGWSVAISAGTMVAGAAKHTPGGCGYVFSGASDGVPDTCSGPCPWDMDGGGTVGINDFLSVLGAWGTNPGGPPDFDGDGTVGITDFLAILGNWGPCG